jgi:hypothetical protein
MCLGLLLGLALYPLRHVRPKAIGNDLFSLDWGEVRVLPKHSVRTPTLDHLTPAVIVRGALQANHDALFSPASFKGHCVVFANCHLVPFVHSSLCYTRLGCRASCPSSAALVSPKSNRPLRKASECELASSTENFATCQHAYLITPHPPPQVGSLPRTDADVGTGLVGAPA